MREGDARPEPVSEPNRDDVASQLALHWRRLYRFAWSLTHDSAAAEDLVQDTMLRALQATHRFEPGTNLRAWLTEILRNRFRDQCRHGAVAAETDIDFRELGEPDGEPWPSCLDLISMDDVRSAADRLEDRLRETFMLSYVDLLSYRAIATQLKIPVSTVGVRLWRARRTLQAILTPIHEARLQDLWRPVADRRERIDRSAVVLSERLLDVVGSGDQAAPPPRVAVF